MSYSELQIRALQIARTQIGVKEQGGRNRGPMVDIYLASVGLPPGKAWCQAFDFWVLDEAARELGIANPHYRGGGVLQAWRKAPPAARIFAATVRSGKIIPSRGSLFVLKTGTKTGHIGFSERVWGDGRKLSHYDTVEGNTNDAGSREGDCVAERERLLSAPELLGFLDYSRLDAPGRSNVA